MERRRVYLGSIENALKMIKAIEKLDVSMSLIHGSKTVDAKSILGVFSMDLDKPMDLEIKGSENNRRQAVQAIKIYMTD